MAVPLDCLMGSLFAFMMHLSLIFNFNVFRQQVFPWVEHVFECHIANVANTVVGNRLTNYLLRADMVTKFNYRLLKINTLIRVKFLYFLNILNSLSYPCEIN